MKRIEGEIYSQLTADELHRVLVFSESNLPDDHFKLEMVTYRPGATNPEVKLPFLWVAPIGEASVTRLADGVEIVHCLSDGERKVDIELGVPGGREVRPARIRLEQ